MSEDSAIILSMFQWAVAGLIAVVAWMVRKLFLVENKEAVCSAVQDEMKAQFHASEDRRDAQRIEVIAVINRTNDQVIVRIDRLEELIKNGH